MTSYTYNLTEIDEIASAIKKQLKHSVVLFNGQMGAGKTTFIQALIKQLGFNIKASSPTFSLVNEYQNSNSKVYHFDLYRIKNLQEALDFGFEEYIDSGHFCFIEWPEHIINLLDNFHVISIDALEYDKRILLIE